MNKLKTLVFALLASFATSPLYAGSADFAGPFIGVQASSIGVELDGTFTDSQGAASKGTGGKTAQIGGLELGYNIPLGESLFVGIGGTWVPGDADIGKAEDAAKTGEVKLNAEAFLSYYVKPSISLSDSSAMYIKIGQSEADLAVTGDFTGSSSKELSGDLVAIGSTSIFPSGMFVQTEAGLIEYDSITVNDIGNAGNNGGKADAKADPSIAYGAITIGYKF